MSTHFERNFAWQARWLPTVRGLLGSRLLREATEIEDRYEATDLVLAAKNGLRIGVRLRRPETITNPDWNYEVTVTSRREDGGRCEWDKMIGDGWADWFFYGIPTRSEPAPGERIRYWYIVDLGLARRWMIENHGPEVGHNGDEPGRRCFFFAFPTRRMVRALGPEVLLDFRPRRSKRHVLPGPQADLFEMAALW